MLIRPALLALFLVALPDLSEQGLHVAPLAKEGQVFVTFKLEQTLTPELRQKIQSGMTLSFIYKVDLKRSSAIWADRTIGSALVTATLKYDNLTRKYHLSRILDGSTHDADVTEREDVAWAWVTTEFRKLPLFRRVALEENAEYYVRVRAHTAPRSASFVWPWQGDEFVGLAKFTFLR